MVKSITPSRPDTRAETDATPQSIAELRKINAALRDELAVLRDSIAALRHQLDWFRRQVFDQKSERGSTAVDSQQFSLEDMPSSKNQHVTAHTRHAPTAWDKGEEFTTFFEESQLPVEIIPVPNPEAEGLSTDDYTVVGEKISYRLAQRPGSYVILKYVLPVIKRHTTHTISCPPAPTGILEGSRADVSFIAGLLVDKFEYHLPLYRQHQRLKHHGIRVSRPWLTQLAHSASALLVPIHTAQLTSVRGSRVIAIDETPIKAGRSGNGTMHSAYFWPVYGEQDEVCFLYYPTRVARHIGEALGDFPPLGRVLLTQGYQAYQSYATKTGIRHAQCWVHTRRMFIDACKYEPEPAAYALDLIGQLYAVEARIREQGLTSQEKRNYRLHHARPITQKFFGWIMAKFEAHGLLPGNPLIAAMHYAKVRREGLEVFLTDPDVPVDTNYVERTLQVIPMGRKNWNFCWTELGAEYVSVVQSLLVTCRLQGVDPYEYLIDVLQRISQHPVSELDKLTPRLWKQHFMHQALRSDLHQFSNDSAGRWQIS